MDQWCVLLFYLFRLLHWYLLCVVEALHSRISCHAMIFDLICIVWCGFVDWTQKWNKKEMWLKRMHRMNWHEQNNGFELLRFSLSFSVSVSPSAFIAFVLFLTWIFIFSLLLPLFAFDLLHVNISHRVKRNGIIKLKKFVFVYIQTDRKYRRFIKSIATTNGRRHCTWPSKRNTTSTKTAEKYLFVIVLGVWILKFNWSKAKQKCTKNSLAKHFSRFIWLIIQFHSKWTVWWRANERPNSRTQKRRKNYHQPRKKHYIRKKNLFLSTTTKEGVEIRNIFSELVCHSHEEKKPHNNQNINNPKLECKRAKGKENK